MASKLLKRQNGNAQIKIAYWFCPVNIFIRHNSYPRESLPRCSLCNWFITFCTVYTSVGCSPTDSLHTDSMLLTFKTSSHKRSTVSLPYGQCTVVKWSLLRVYAFCSYIAYVLKRESWSATSHSVAQKRGIHFVNSPAVASPFALSQQCNELYRLISFLTTKVYFSFLFSAVSMYKKLTWTKILAACQSAPSTKVVGVVLHLWVQCSGGRLVWVLKDHLLFYPNRNACWLRTRFTHTLCGLWLRKDHWHLFLIPTHWHDVVSIFYLYVTSVLRHFESPSPLLDILHVLVWCFRLTLWLCFLHLVFYLGIVLQ